MSWQIVCDQPSELGESPFWHPQEQMLYWVDISGRQIHRANVFMGSVERWAMPQEVGCIAPVAGGGLVVALRDEIFRSQAWQGELHSLAHFDYDARTTRFNDGKCDPLGRFWAGTVYEPKDAPKAALYSLDCRNRRDGRPAQVELKADGALTANGLAWSPDRRTVYWADTPRHIIYQWDWDAQTNAMAHQRVFMQFPSKPDGWQFGQPGYGGRPDGAAVDALGNYYVAMFEGMRVLKFSPSGQLLADIAAPVPCPTMVCFGGDDLQTLYLTSARHKRPAQELQTYPLSGCVFSMRVDTPGLPVNFFSD